MKIFWALLALLSGVSFRLSGLQAKTPEAALEEIATAEKPEMIARHLPEQVQRSIDDLPKLQKQQVLDKLLAMKSEQLDGCTLRRAGDADGWEIIDHDGEKAGKVRLANVFISGLDALLSLKLDSEDGSQTFMVAMHLEGDDWRIDDFGPWTKTNLRLRQLVHQPSESEKNEAAAKAKLQEMVAALDNYVRQYPPNGYPSRLAMLVGDLGHEPSAEHAGLLDESFAAMPLIMNGYEFRYALTRAGGGGDPNIAGHYKWLDDGLDFGWFEILAIPVDFGKTGTKSFFVDRTSTIRATSENRPANEGDPAVSDDEI